MEDGEMYSDGEGARSNSTGSVMNEGSVLTTAADCEEGDNDVEKLYEDNDTERVNIYLDGITPHDVKQMEFSNPDAGYAFYNEFGKRNGFCARRNKKIKNSRGEIVSYSFVCSREGFRANKYLCMENRKREHRPVTRCGCKAEMRIRFNEQTGLWFVIYLNDEHNHALLGDMHTRLLPSHRKMLAADIAQMNTMRESGISIPKIYATFARQSGGYSTIGFRKRELYNQVERQRNLQDGDVNQAFEYLQELAEVDSMMFWRYRVDKDGKLLHLFWCDGSSQVDYLVFGDVLAFDATYGRNKYKCPLVVFSGVNHHNNTCVFGSAIVSDETEETYVWVLKQFLEAMKGKTPQSVITDGDYAMKNAIKRVFPGAHHRLCAWHLLRNATSNVCNPRFTRSFKTCMLADIEVEEFEDKWESMLEECGLDNIGAKGREWVIDLYEKKGMWATAHIRGKFYAGLRTTSRCESLHAKLGKFVEPRHGLSEFLVHFQRALEYLRDNEVQADFKSSFGEPVLQTHLQRLERSAARVFTREIFWMIRSTLLMAGTVMVTDCRQCSGSDIYVVAKYCKPKTVWHVSHYRQEHEFTCSCRRLESFGLPCLHIIAVLLYLSIDELPRCLVLERWTKQAKSSIGERILQQPLNAESALYMSHFGALLHSCRRMCSLAARNNRDYNDLREKIEDHTALLLSKQENYSGSSSFAGGQNGEFYLMELGVVRRKRPGLSHLSVRRKNKRVPRCGNCKQQGHVRTTCPLLKVGKRAWVKDGVGSTSIAEFEILQCQEQTNDGTVDYMVGDESGYMSEERLDE